MPVESAIMSGRRTPACVGVVVEQVAAVVGPRVGDDVGALVVDDALLGVEEPVLAVLGARVVDRGAGGHRVHGLDVEVLLAEPAACGHTPTRR